MAEVDATRACVVCGTLFARYKTKSVCSDACAATRQRKYQANSDARKAKPTRQCKWCAAEFTPARGTGYIYCGDAHAKAAKDARESARRADPEYIARHKQHAMAWVVRNREKYRKQQSQSKQKSRAKNGRGDRSGEYANKRARALSVIRAAMLWVDVQYHMAHAEALAMNAEIDRSRRAQRKAERAARKEAARQPRAAGTQSAYIVALKANPAAYSRELARWRAKTLKRKTGVVMKSDGTATAAIVLGGTSCLYCDCKLSDANRSHDHMTPVVMGGVHSAANIAPCCLQCNARKGAKDFMSFVSTLPIKDQRRAIKFYEKRNGSVAQTGLCLAA